MPRKRTTWIVVADGARACILARHGLSVDLTPVKETSSAASRARTRELGVERPGRAFESADASRHAIEPRVDWHRFEKAQFARRLAGLLDHAEANGSFDELIVVAPPKTLGDLRKEIGAATRAKVKAEIDKDLTNLPPASVADHLVDDGVL